MMDTLGGCFRQEQRNSGFLTKILILYLHHTSSINVQVKKELEISVWTKLQQK